MKLSILAATILLSISAPVSHAGGFVDLPTTGKIRVFGNNNQATDSMYLPGLPAGWTEVASSVSALTWSAVDVKNPDGSTFTYGTFQDKVYRNDADNTLMFASRLSLNIDLGNDLGEFSAPPGWTPEENAYTHLFYNEANYIWRSGFTGFETAAAWYQENQGGPYFHDFDDGNGFVDTYAYAGDFRLKIAVMSSAKFSQVGATNEALNPVYNPDVVGFATDVSVPEGNPNGGWYLVKTNATNYTTLNNAVRVLQDGGNGEGRPTRNFYLTGFSPTAVPEADQWLLMLLGLMTVGFVVHRCRIYSEDLV